MFLFLLNVCFQVIRNVCKAGPLHLAGFSFGCIVVQEMLLQLQASQYDVRSVFLLDGSTQFTKLHMAKIKSKDSAVLEDLNQNAAIHILKDMAVQFTQGVSATFNSIVKILYRKFPKYSDTPKICCNHSKI